MADYIGVLPWYEGDIADELRRAAIVFDKIAFAHVHTQMECRVFEDSDDGRRTLDTVEELGKYDLLLPCPDRSAELSALAGVDQEFSKRWQNETNFVLYGERDYGQLSPASVYLMLAMGALKQKGLAEYRRGPFHARGMRFCDMYARMSAAYFAHVEQQEAMPIVRSLEPPRSMQGLTRTSAVSILLRQVAVPTDQTTIQDILAFRQDSTVSAHHRRLMSWIEDELQQPVNVKRFESDLQVKIHDHAAYLAKYHKTFRWGSAEAVSVFGFEAMEALSTLQFSKPLKTLFSLRRQEIDLVNVEIASPAAEVAYIARANDWMTDTNRGAGPGRRPYHARRRSATHARYAAATSVPKTAVAGVNSAEAPYKRWATWLLYAVAVIALLAVLALLRT